MSELETWDRQRIIDEKWIRFSVKPERQDLRDFVQEFRDWFSMQCSGRGMYHVQNYESYATVAFSNDADVGIFMLRFYKNGVVVRRVRNDLYVFPDYKRRRYG